MYTQVRAHRLIWGSCDLKLHLGYFHVIPTINVTSCYLSLVQNTDSQKCCQHVPYLTPASSCVSGMEKDRGITGLKEHGNTGRRVKKEAIILT